MRLLFPVWILASLALAGCRTAALPPVRITPDVTGWHARTPAVEGVRAYATSLDRLNPEHRRGAFDASDGLTLTEAEAVALFFNADLRARRLEAKVPALGAVYAGLLDDPRLELDVLRILQSVSSPWLLATGLQLSLPLSGRLGLERAEAFAQADAALRRAHLAEWSLVTRLREAWNVWSATGERIRLLQEHVAAVQDVLRVAVAQREAEQIAATQVRVLELEEVTRMGELDALRVGHERQLLELKALMGLVPEAEVALLPELSLDVGCVAPAAEEAQLRQANLELQIAHADFVVADRTLRLEAAKRFPDLELGPLFETEQGIERLGLGIGISLPLWNRNRRAIAEACAARNAARAAYQARYEELVSTLARSRSECLATARRMAWLTERVAPLADQQLQDVRRLGELGDMDVLILKDALTTVLETKIQLLDARLESALATNRRRALVEPLVTPDGEGIR